MGWILSALLPINLLSLALEKNWIVMVWIVGKK